MKAPIRDWVAIILAVGLSSSVTIITIAVLYEAIQQNAPLSENATQVLDDGLLGGSSASSVRTSASGRGRSVSSWS